MTSSQNDDARLLLYQRKASQIRIIEKQNEKEGAKCVTSGYLENCCKLRQLVDIVENLI